ncbi:MAG: PTS mannitol transporter subunit IICBA [Lachnospiraceae bacterium]|jgi:PTS system mannitol-specific IIC component|nr:PTS mannitol transporter subunit IICBA [Lachnospiraceae bacterium]
MKNGVQKFGKFLSSMVMPNIGAFIAWGLITALFIADGWLPNKGLASIHPYMLTYLLPMLIASTGGALVGGDRGRVMGAIAVVGCIAGVGGIDGEPMLMGAMVIGPFAGWVIKMFDRYMEDRMPTGFEMLINNFSVGILGMIIAIIGYFIIGPVMTGILAVLSAGVEVLVTHSLLPLVSVFIEPAKVLFLNNALNHGIFTPIGSAQAEMTGRSIMYMLEANPGPGLGVLLAYCFFAKDKTTKQSAPGAVIIHFFGGIHEIYFPYVLMNPLVIIAPIVGNFCSIAFFSLTGCGLKAPSSPGSIIAFLSMTPKDKMLFTILGVLLAAGVSFLIASPIIKLTDGKKGSLSDAQDQMSQMKAEAKGQAVVQSGSIEDVSVIKKIIFACDAGMGSSAMGATKFRNRLKDVRPEIIVKNTSVDNIPVDCDVAVVQATLAGRARKSAPQAVLITIGNFLADPSLDALYEQLAAKDRKSESAKEEPAAAKEGTVDNSSSKKVIDANGIRLNQRPVSKEEAIRTAGELLVKQGCVGEAYVDAMIERERLVSTYMGMGLAIPHGTSEAKGSVKKTGIVLVQYPEGIDFGEEKAQLVFGIAGIGDEHLDLLAKICEALEDEDVLEKMKTTDDVAWILQQLS